MGSQCFTMVRGRVMRVTRLDGCGRIKSSGCASITSKGFVSIAFTANIDEGEEITVTNAGGETCVRDTPTPKITGYTIVVTFCDVDPELYAMMTGQVVVYDTRGDAVGFRVNTGVDASASGFALETWSNVPGVACSTDSTAQGSYGYTLVPFVQGGVLGDFTLENNAVTFSLQNASTKSGGAWGTGPYNVVPSVAGTSEVQTLTISGTPTGGTFTMSFGGYTTAPIAHNANAAAIQTALQSLASIGSGNVAVTGAGPYTITFRGSMAQRDVAQITTVSSLTGGSSPAATVATTTPGVSPSAGPLSTPIGAKDHLHVQLTTIAPPTPGCSCLASGVAATGATAGAPGSWTPVDSYPPLNLVALQTASPAITATPGTAWTTGQHVVLGDGSKAFWNGTAWVAGTA